MTPHERFLSKLDKSGDCWLWTGWKTKDGYGMTSGGYVHRKAYEILVGPIAQGLTIDHLCKVRHCCNPEHLEAISQRENMLRGSSPAAQALRTNQCKRGHELTPENVYILRQQQGRYESRMCKTCKAQRDAVYQQKQRDKRTRQDSANT